jgi:hypothetical protein
MVAVTIMGYMTGHAVTVVPVQAGYDQLPRRYDPLHANGKAEIVHQEHGCRFCREDCPYARPEYSYWGWKRSFTLHNMARTGRTTYRAKALEGSSEVYDPNPVSEQK